MITGNDNTIDRYRRTANLTTFLAAAALLAGFCLALAYIGLAAWGNAARDTVGVAFFLALTVQLVVSGVARVARHRARRAANGQA